MEEIFVIGNGPSREVVNLEKLHTYGKIYGCNALYRTFTPDMLFVVDNNILKEISAKKYAGRLHTQVNDKSLKNITLEQKERRKSSGGLAMQQAARDTKTGQIYMLGFDNPRSTPYTHANIYAGSPNYVRKTPWGWKAFESDYANIMKRYHTTKFINVINPDICSDMLDTLGETCPNYSVIEYKDFPYQDCIAPAEGR